ncbi:MAG: diguanylate cyclase [Nitrospirota bacterium]
MSPDVQELVLKRIARWSFLSVLVISSVSLLGWVSGLFIVTMIRTDYVPIAPSTALCFILLSASLLVHALDPRSSARRLIAVVCACLTALICLTILALFIFGITSSVEHLGIEAAPSMTNIPSGHMSPITAVAFFLTGLGVLFLVYSEGRQWLKQAAAFPAMAAGSIGFIVILGYLHGTPLLYGGNIIPVALPTAIAFVLIALGLIAATGPSVFPVRGFIGPTVRSRLMRAFLPSIVIFILIDGLIYETTFSRARNPALISSAIALLSIILVGVLVSKISKSIGDEIDRAHSERDIAEVENRKTEAKYKNLVDSSLDGIYEVNAEGVFVLMNLAGAKIFGHESPRDMVGRNALEYWRDPKDREAFRKQLHLKKALSAYHMRAKSKDGEPIELESSSMVIEDKNGNFLGIKGILRDVTARKRMEERLRELSITDELTGLYNRRGFYALAERELKMASRLKRDVYVISADMDGLKVINDTLGHQEGDRALIEIAGILKETCRNIDIISRIGGDEFVVVPVGTTRDSADLIVARLQKNVGTHNNSTSRRYKLSLSAGVGYYDPSCPCSLDELLIQADTSMYEQKKDKQKYSIT